MMDDGTVLKTDATVISLEACRRRIGGIKEVEERLRNGLTRDQYRALPIPQCLSTRSSCIRPQIWRDSTPYGKPR